MFTVTLAEGGDDSDSGDDVEMGGVTQNFLCPLTLTPLTNPVTSLVFCLPWFLCATNLCCVSYSRVCGHSFSRDALQQFFKGERTQECPTSGCNKSFKFSDCVPDDALAKKVKAHQRRQRAAETDSEDEDVVD